MRALIGIVLVALALPAAADDAAIVRHGPWPPPWQPDPSNRVSGNAEAAALGRRLFFDARLSPSGRVACSSCHRPERAFTDGRPRGIGLGISRRNTPGLLDVRANRWLGWGGAGDSLWAQSIRPLLDPREMGASATHVKSHIARDADLAARWASVLGRGRTIGESEAETVLVDAAKALAAYQETITGGRTPFDDYRDALAGGNAAMAARYPAAARRGAALFVGAAGCSACHSGPAFSDGAFHVVGPVRAGDDGRRRDLRLLLASPYSRRGPHSDDAERQALWGPHDDAGGQAPGTAGAFRTPTLRHLARTGPWLHDGTAPALAAAITAHRGGPRLDTAQLGDLVAFLHTLGPPAP